jgi:tellurite resistance protein TerC
MGTSVWPWLSFFALVLGLLALDLGIFHRKARAISLGGALWLSLLYIVLALLFAAGVFWFRGTEAGFQFLTGYLVEKSLSLDNIFVFYLLFSSFSVPAEYQHRVLFWGVLGALAMRGVLILAGVQLIHTFSWMALVFGAFLILTGIKMLQAADREPDLRRNLVLRSLRRHLRVTETYEGRYFLVRRDGALHVTPLFLVLVLVEFSDLLFAIDSIPAVLAITTNPFIVYTSNVFAILGLRALYFALAGIVPRFIYLKYALSLILVLVGAKMVANHLFGENVIPTPWALLATAGLIGGAIILSLIRTRDNERPARPVAPTGRVPGSPSSQSRRAGGNDRPPHARMVPTASRCDSPAGIQDRRHDSTGGGGGHQG